MRCTYLLADTPEYLRDKDLIKGYGIGNTSKGVTATKPINDYANKLIKDWLMLPKTIIEYNNNDEEIETQIFNLYFLKNRALLKELSLYSPDINVDRVRSLGILLLYRNQFMIRYEGDIARHKDKSKDDYFANSEFFSKNYDERFRGGSSMF